jgi:hypothetical protein
VPILAVIILSVLKWRVNDWMQVIHHLPHSHPMPWSNLLFTATLFGCVQLVVMERVGFWKHNPFARTRISADVSVGPVRKLEMIGFNFLYVDKQVTLKTISQTAGEEVPKLRAAIKAANIQPRGPVVFIYPRMTGRPDVVLEVKIGIAVEETPTAPEGYQVEEIPPTICQTVLHGGPMTTLREAFGVLGPKLYGSAPAPTGEIRVYCYYFEATDSPNNATLIAAVVK